MERKLNHTLLSFKPLSFKLICAAFCFGLSGMSRGLDEGLISTTVAQKSFIREFDLDSSERASYLSNVTSMVHIGSIPGALIAFLLCERIGMLWSMRQLCMVWLVGVVVVITADGRIGQIYAGRFVMGLGIGQSGVVGPTYLAEVAPARTRGMLVSVFGMSEYIGIMIGYFAAWGAALHISNDTAKQWIIPQSIQIVVAGVLGLSSFLCEESPRHLCRIGKPDLAKRALGRLWSLPKDHGEILMEMQGIRSQIETEQGSTAWRSWKSSLKELLVVKSNRNKLLFVASGQILSQWSGANSMTTYAPELFSLFGLTGQSEKLFTTAIFGAVKFVASLIAAFIMIDHIGRKKSLATGILVQQIAMLYIALYLTVVSLSSDQKSSSADRAGLAAIIFMYIVGIGWALGWNSIQYLMNAEVFPLRVRATGTSLLMCFHYANRYGLSKAVPYMLLQDSLQPKGTFWFFSVMTLFGFWWTWLLLPETAGQALEETNKLFS
ncbi:hypothetical protein N7462_006286 [Penicillium macrosclerotiorum]|uniref:uncharacterized protein n=1 Tax=Penicillium macrosclerotiorum TaxID=303699 RepID=UPI0025492E8C|nr:uncharacterized protein N7462_006286 [Penicillium macrosclerotiorum]KAJ5683121.1 hypothetical protein N7462_006286 [Penicillium macrosclerotiorum]